MIHLLWLLFFTLFGTMASKPLHSKGFDRETSDGNRSLLFTLRWKKLRVAEMLFSISGENDEYWEISGRTLGPLRLVKDYEGKAKQRYDADGQEYRLEGRDQGFLENREIFFRSGYLPMVREFVDRTAATSLTPEPSWGKSAISPIGLFRQILNSTRSPSLCSGSIIVYDGKRAYTVELNGNTVREGDLRILDLSEIRGRVFWKCSATMYSRALIQTTWDSDVESEEILKEFTSEERADNDISAELEWSKVWLFGSKNRRIDFILSTDCAAFELVGFLISSPLGRIIGRPPSACEVRD